MSKRIRRLGPGRPDLLSATKCAESMSERRHQDLFVTERVHVESAGFLLARQGLQVGFPFIWVDTVAQQ